jgi:hypothetical protein
MRVKPKGIIRCVANVSDRAALGSQSIHKQLRGISMRSRHATRAEQRGLLRSRKGWEVRVRAVELIEELKFTRAQSIMPLLSHLA